MAVSGAVVMVGCAAAYASSSPVMWLCDEDGGVAVANAGSMARWRCYCRLCVAAQWSFAWTLMVQISVGALRRMRLALAAAMEMLVAVADLRSVDDGSNLARVQAVDMCWWWTLQVLPWWLQVQTMLLLLRNAGCYCGAGTRGHGGAANGVHCRCQNSPARKLNTMAPVHLEPRHKRNSMASGNDRGQKRCL